MTDFRCVTKTEEEDARSLNTLILFGLHGAAEQAYRAAMLGCTDRATELFFYRTLAELGNGTDPDVLFETLREIGRIDLKCMALSEGANEKSIVDPAPSDTGIFQIADQIAAGVRSGAVRRVFIIGAENGNDYYDEFVKLAPIDSVILIPDKEGVIGAVAALTEAFDCSAHDLPLTVALSWRDRNTVSVLPTLMYLGVGSILLGPSLPSFVSPNVLQMLADRCGVMAVTDPETDLDKIFTVQY